MQANNVGRIGLDLGGTPDLVLPSKIRTLFQDRYSRPWEVTHDVKLTKEKEVARVFAEVLDHTMAWAQQSQAPLSVRAVATSALVYRSPLELVFIVIAKPEIGVFNTACFFDDKNTPHMQALAVISLVKFAQRRLPKVPVGLKLEFNLVVDVLAKAFG